MRATIVLIVEALTGATKEDDWKTWPVAGLKVVQEAAGGTKTDVELLMTTRQARGVASKLNYRFLWKPKYQTSALIF